MDIDFRNAKELGSRLLTQLDALRDESHLLWSDNHKAWIATGHGIVAIIGHLITKRVPGFAKPASAAAQAFETLTPGEVTRNARHGRFD